VPETVDALAMIGAMTEAMTGVMTGVMTEAMTGAVRVGATEQLDQ